MENSRNIKHIVILLLMIISIVDSTSTFAKENVELSSNEILQLEFADSVLDYADDYLGTRYRAGSSSPKGFDCSGFTSYIFSKIGYDLNRSSKGQFYDGEFVTKDLLLPGDLVFFGGTRSKNTVGHVGIVTSVTDYGFKFIHASRSGIRVSKYPQEEYYSQRYIGARRVLSPKEVEEEQPTFVTELLTKIESGVSLLNLEPPINPLKLSFKMNLSSQATTN